MRQVSDEEIEQFRALFDKMVAGVQRPWAVPVAPPSMREVFRQSYRLVRMGANPYAGNNGPRSDEQRVILVRRCAEALGREDQRVSGGRAAARGSGWRLTYAHREVLYAYEKDERGDEGGRYHRHQAMWSLANLRDARGKPAMRRCLEMLWETRRTYDTTLADVKALMRIHFDEVVP